MHKLYLTRLDLAYHQEYEKYKNMEPDDVDNAVSKTYIVLFDEPHKSKLRSHRHIFKEPIHYAAGLYSYLWSNILDADYFSKFLKEGIMNEKIGMEFRREILEKGNLIPVQEQFRNFMGRNPSQEALMKRDGFNSFM